MNPSKNKSSSIERRRARLEREDLVHVWFTKPDAEMIRQAAKNNGLGISAFIRQSSIVAARNQSVAAS